jgi:hypothetical protein
MNWSDIGKEISKYAPLVGGALGGAAGAGIGTLISSVLGCDDDPKAISNALSDPANIEKIVSLQKSHEVELQKAMIAASVEHAKIDQADRQDAREEYKNSKMPAFVTFFMFALLLGVGCAMFFVPIPQENKQAVDLLSGAVISWCGSIVHGYFGSGNMSTKRVK